MKSFSHLFWLPCLLLTLIGAQVQAQTPTAHYSFTGNATDAINGNNAAVNGATLTQDRFNIANRAFAFDGVQGGLRAVNTAVINTANESISFWVKVKALPVTGEAYILSHGGWQDRWKISLPAHGKPVFSTKNAAGQNVDMDSDSVALPVGAWRHIVMTHDGTNNIIYINGVLKKSVASAGALGNTTKPFGIGYDPIDTANYFNGALDEVMLFNVALTGAQVTTLYTTQSTAPIFANERVAAYSLNGGGLDSSVYANHAAATNVSTTTDRFGFGSKAINFNGSSSVKAPNSAPLNSASTTVSFWVRVNALPVTGELFLFSYGGWQERLKISLPAHGKVVFSTNNVGTGNSDMDAGDGNALPVGVWKHVVMTHDGTNDKVFIDGVKKNTKAVTGALKTTIHPVGIGYDPIDGGSFFNGAMDEVQVYNYALTEGEVTALYTAQSTSPATATDIVADYKLNSNGNDDTQFGNQATGKATPSANRFNYGSNAMSFNGTKTDSLIASNSVVLQADYETISFWIKVTALPVTGEAYLLSHGGWQDRWKISLPSHGKPVFSTKNAAGNNVDMDSDSVPMPVGAWRHIVMLHDGTNNKLFVNGLLKKSVAATGALGKTNKPVGIGYDPIDGGANFNGNLDDIKLYNRALTDAEVAALYTVQNTAPVIAGTLVANYPFNNDGTDITPYGNNAATTNAVPTSDRFNKSNKAFAFNNSQAKAANSAQLNSANTTISFWVKVAALPASGEAYILSHGGWQDRWKISLPSHGKPVFSTKNAAGQNVDMDADSVSLPVGAWRHVAMTHDGTNNKIFINGLLKKSVVSAGGLGTTTKPFGIGYDPIDSSGFFNGALDDIQIYNVALTDAEIAALYAAQNTAAANTDTQAPSTPLSITAAVAFTNVTLAWLPSTDNVGVVGYNVFKNNALLMTTPNTSTLLAGLTPTTKFTFGVTAIDAAGNESAMSTLQVTTGQDQARDSVAPSVPTNLAAQVGSNSVQLSWTASTDNRAVVGYIVFQDGTVIDTVLAPTLTKFVSGLASLTPYSYEVLAYDAAKNKSAKAEKTVTTLAPVNTGEPGLIANYPFDDNANDATPYNNHGTIGGAPTFITHTGLAGKAIKFGKTDSVIVKNAVQLISDYATVGFWIRVDSVNLADAEAYIIDFGHWDQRWKISLPQHTKIVWTTNSKNALSNNFITDMDSGDGNELVKGIWWHVTMVHDGVSNIVYVNGVETKRAATTGKLNSTARPMYIGNNGVDGGQHFFGALDNLKLYNKAMTAAEINKLFRTGTTPVDDQPTAALLTLVKGLSPNPVSDMLTVQHNFTGKEEVLVRVFDILGRQVDAINFNKNDIPVGQFSLNTSHYPAGTYLIGFVQDGKSLGALKFIKN